MSSRLLLLMRRRGGGGALDSVKTSVGMALSMRRLLSSYKGSAIRVREDSGNTEADIGFDANGDLDTTALLAHTGANSGYVTTWYDQSGRARNLVQAIAGEQPRIVSSGTVDVNAGGLPHLVCNFGGLALQNWAATYTDAAETDASVLLVIKPDDAEDQWIVLSGQNSATMQIGVADKGGASTVIVTNAGTPAFYKNGSLLSLTTRDDVFDAYPPGSYSLAEIRSVAKGDWTAVIPVGYSGAGFSYAGNICEFVLLRSGGLEAVVESAINAYWGIY